MLVLESASIQIEHGGQSAGDPSAIVDVGKDLLRDFEVPLVLCRLVEVEIGLDELWSKRVPWRSVRRILLGATNEEMRTERDSLTSIDVEELRKSSVALER